MRWQRSARGLGQWLNGSAQAFVQLPKPCEDEINLRTCPRLDSLGQDWVLLNLLLGTNPELSCTTEIDDETAHARARGYIYNIDINTDTVNNCIYTHCFRPLTHRSCLVFPATWHPGHSATRTLCKSVYNVSRGVRSCI